MQIGLLLASLALAHPAPAPSAFLSLPQRVLIVGGGPDLSHNQVAIESNVRYVLRMLPKDQAVRVLFADGDPTSKTVLYEDENHKSQFRASQIPHIDGPSRLNVVKQEVENAGASLTAKQPVFLYFTGHVSPNGQSGDTNNQFDLWKGEVLSVKDLAASLKTYPKGVPVTLLMVECFSGAFGNVLFEGGDPKGALSDQPICGFFASIAQRPAAGCTPELNEANYRDFTSYFVAALTGTDRVGRTVAGADYDHNGKIGMNEAFAYALIHDDSIDTPVCTSDVFLRRFVTTPEPEVFTNQYTDVLSWSTPAQKAALESLSSILSLNGDSRGKEAYGLFQKINPESDADRDVHLIRFVRLFKTVVLSHQLKSLPDMDVRRRYDELVKLEAGNPFVP
jgi:hypothetical protein